MNILILNSTSDLYGSSKILVVTVQALVKAGHYPIVVLSEDGPLVKELEAVNVKVLIIRLGILRRKYFNIPGLINRVKVTSTAWKLLNKVVKEENIEHIYSNTTGVLIGAFLAKKNHLKHTWHIHEIITSPMIFTRFISYLLKKYSHQVIVVSEAVKSHWQKFVGSTEITRIYNGIDGTQFENTTGTLKDELNLSPQTILIGMIGRVNHWKGQEYFLEIASFINKENPSAHFVLAGDAYPGNEHLVIALNEQIKNSGFADKITNVGYRTDIPNLINSFDVFISPSTLPDPFPTVILEAMSASKMVVATKHGGAVEMVDHGISGILIPVNNAKEAAQLIMEQLRQPENIINMGKNGNQRIHQLFSHDAFDKAIASIF